MIASNTHLNANFRMLGISLYCCKFEHCDYNYHLKAYTYYSTMNHFLSTHTSLTLHFC